MDDKELLMAAAKAADISIFDWHDDGGFTAQNMMEPWNPLTNDAHALRLAVKLGLLSLWEVNRASEVLWASECPYAATRRAIVQAAAALVTPNVELSSGAQEQPRSAAGSPSARTQGSASAGQNKED